MHPVSRFLARVCSEIVRLPGCLKILKSQKRLRRRDQRLPPAVCAERERPPRALEAQQNGEDKRCHMMEIDFWQQWRKIKADYTRSLGEEAQSSGALERREGCASQEWTAFDQTIEVKRRGTLHEERDLFDDGRRMFSLISSTWAA